MPDDAFVGGASGCKIALQHGYLRSRIAEDVGA